MKRLMLALILSVCVASQAWAGFDEGVAAHKRGDYNTALSEFRTLAEQGHANAQFSLGVMYVNGQGVPQNYPEAMKWFRKAADQGHAGAQNNLGVMYYKGHGLPQNYVLAHMWVNLAAANSTGEDALKITKARDEVAELMTPAQIAEAQRLAAEWKPTKQ